MGDGEIIRFQGFVLDIGARRLTRGGAPLDLPSRCFDALALLARSPCALVTKDRFLDEVWRGVPVTDEALTQCIRVLRRALGDDAAAPRFIETVPKHGYRFVAAIDQSAEARTSHPPAPTAEDRIPDAIVTAVAGTLGGGVAGFAGGLVFGLVGAIPFGGGGSLAAVLAAAAGLVGAIGGFGVGAGIAAVTAWRGGGAWRILGAAIGGLLVGALTRLLGIDAFALLLGRAPAGMTGGFEGALLGLATGIALWLGHARLRLSVTLAAVTGATAGLMVIGLGGRLLMGSLAALVARFPGSHLRLGEAGFGPAAPFLAAAAEGALFCAGVTGAVLLAERIVLSTASRGTPTQFASDRNAA